ncbi:precorrin-6y C5,15-methyltransferase (decarboxylating) subunit CbiE [Phyllobacterium sp. 21LDTY02-6]|uniref:precorrin-6y C5,15-methyltransferase (decarboxylating) subunit CbiE n=1 Tax=Phyllobacterium sp. 21LDTY02-6 TaxID=2944903 RepID=UPI00202122DF|nr:precorrin-6y C5,15-methyltransferase (decarboxylating) subunit CbiE [Phyllobacterium sp. 21LDTY02-6]MCO4317675.1 precorrin-6y C5,15-methyltransferase (decarboxylating) subunit CbiE [Phyllobacterium sp. 21LDTY02-6]
MRQWLTIIGIGEDGYSGLGEAARNALAQARTVFGGQRHLDHLPEQVSARRIAWPTPFSDAYPLLLERRGEPVAVLASGDPMYFGMGATLTRYVAAEEMHILPAPSSFSLAAARMGWPIQNSVLLSVHGRPLETIRAHLAPGARLLVLSNDGDTPAAAARLLCDAGFGSSRLTVLEHLGGGSERRIDATARDWPHGRCADLNVLAIECGEPSSDTDSLPLVAGLPDGAFRHDGQLTKRDIRSVTLSHLAPLPGQLLWDVGAGCGSIGIEWMRSHPSCRAIAIEANQARQEFITHNSRSLGVPGLTLICGEAPAALTGLEAPDAVFIGGGVTDEGVIQTCWEALKPGGRLVANAVTVQSEMLLFNWRSTHGGDLAKLQISHIQAIGGFDGWRAALPVTIYSVRKQR